MRLEHEDGQPVGSPLRAIVDHDEAGLLADGLALCFDEDPVDPGCHTRLGEGDSQLTIAIETPARRTLHTGLDLLTDNQQEDLERLFADDDHAPVEATWRLPADDRRLPRA